MKIIATIARILLGLVFVVFGLNIFLQFLHQPPPSGLAGDFAKALFVSHYIYVVGALQVIGGALLLAGRFVPLGLTLLGPLIVNILLFHILLSPTGLPVAIVVSILALIVLWQHRAAFAGILKSKG
jgi:putative oxidoreductase